MAGIPSRTVTTKNGVAFVIRCPEPDDASNLLTYIRSVAQETGFFIIQPDEFPATEEQERQWIQEHLDDPGKLALIAEVAGKIVGSLSFENGPFRRHVSYWDVRRLNSPRLAGQGDRNGAARNPAGVGGSELVDRTGRALGLLLKRRCHQTLSATGLRGRGSPSQSDQARAWTVHRRGADGPVRQTRDRMRLETRLVAARDELGMADARRLILILSNSL